MAPIDPSIVLHKIVFELRYDYGFTYLDRCGSTINEILREKPGWVVPQISPQAGMLQDAENELQFCFASSKLDLSHTQSDRVSDLVAIDQFARTADDLTKIVVEQLQLTDFTRIGFRAWRIFGTPSLQDAKKATTDLAVIERARFEGLDLGTMEEIGSNLVFEKDGVMTRIAVAAVEQHIKVDAVTRRDAETVPHKLPTGQKEALARQVQAKRLAHHYPQFGVLVDTDHSILDPPFPDRLKASGFVMESFEAGQEIARKIIDPKG